jgi:HEAT repeat protein
MLLAEVHMTPKPAAKPPQRNFDKELAELDALAASFKAGEPHSDGATQHLRKTLGHRSNFLVGKAARLVADAELTELLPDVLAAYDRFYINPVKTDPNCWAKNALAKALVALEHRERTAYLRGLQHHQLEPVWGGSSDTAGTLRATCAHALVDCPGISDADLLTALLDPLTDTDKTVRVEAARAIGRVGGVSAALVLRLRAMLGPALHDQEDPEVLGAVYSALLGVEGVPAIPLVAAALKEGDDLAAEAALALADTRTPEALAALEARLRAGADTWFASVLLSAIALTRQPAAFDYLIDIIHKDAREAPAAIEALGRIALNAEVRARVRQSIEETGSQRLAQAFREHFPEQPD